MNRDEIVRRTLAAASGDKWKKIGMSKRAGTLVALFSVYSRRSQGIGDLGDLRLLIDWARETGNSILQLLPMNDVGVTFCPYDSVSSFALEPMYAALEDLPGCKNKVMKSKIETFSKAFPSGRPHVDYRVKEAKVGLLREIYAREKGPDSPRLMSFRQENAYWVQDFALFKALKEHYGGSAWYDWEDGYRQHDSACLKDFYDAHRDPVDFVVWVQWQLYNQFQQAKEYAATKGVLLKGDLPILASIDSADVWAHQEFFKLGFAAGAPPDMYCEKGQRWGTPTYDWERVAGDNYRYLKEKLAYAGHFYDILRIDHVVGLFRIWSIPVNEPQENKGFNGFFDPGDEHLWGPHGRKILSVMLENTDMLLCAEDLGVVPKACTEALKDFGIPGNEVQRWVKDWNVRHDFLRPEEYRALSVAMLSTHDTTNWAAWWEHEAGTVDEALFMRKCRERGIAYDAVKDTLFDTSRSSHGRLRWKESVSSWEVLASILGRQRQEVLDFIDMYENSYREKEKLWKHLGLKGPMREKSDPAVIASALKVTLDSSALFCIQLVTDWLFLSDIFKGDPYQYRINTPGTVRRDNWSLTLPLSLEALLEHRVCRKIKEQIASSGRLQDGVMGNAL